MSQTDPIVLGLWHQGRSLRVSGIYRPDDTVARLDFKKMSDHAVHSLVTETRSVADVFSEDPENQSDVYATTMEGPHGTKISAGPTNEGSEGFVAVSSGQVSNLLWLAFFDFSNPFEGTTLRVIDDDRFTVKTNCAAEWLFSIRDPTNIVVTRGECAWPGSEFWPSET